MLGTLISTVRESWGAEGIRSNLWELLKSWGPAWLVMIADVDAASVITAAERRSVRHEAHLVLAHPDHPAVCDSGSGWSSRSRHAQGVG